MNSLHIHCQHVPDTKSETLRRQISDTVNSNSESSAKRSQALEEKIEGKTIIKL